MVKNIPMSQYLWLIELFEKGNSEGGFNHFESTLGIKFHNRHFRELLNGLISKGVLVENGSKTNNGRPYKSFRLDKNKLFDLIVSLYTTKKIVGVLDHKYSIFSVKNLVLPIKEWDIDENTVYKI